MSKVSPSDSKCAAIGRENGFLITSRDVKVHYTCWKPSLHPTPRAMVFLCHGFGEHLLWYEDLAVRFCDYGIIAFGHDHAGHGRSEGTRGHIDDVSEYVTDVLCHCDHMKEQYPSLPCFIVGHSMGGMIAIRSAMTRPSYFKGVVLMGPLIKPDPEEVSPLKVFMARAVSKIWPQIKVAGLKLDRVSRDEDMKSRMRMDPLRIQNGIKARWAVACYETLQYFDQNKDKVEWPFFILHGENDRLCSPKGSKDFFDNASSQDKKLKFFPNAHHHLYLELPDVRLEALSDTVDWVVERIPPLTVND